MPTLNYTTTIPVAKTIGECQSMLARHGAGAVATRYDEGQPVGLSFTLATPHGVRTFSLPVDVLAVHKLLASDRKVRPAQSTPEQAARVAWRVLKDWLAAQLAIIEAQMVQLDQVMLPYLHVDGERTLYQAYRDNERLALETGS